MTSSRTPSRKPPETSLVVQGLRLLLSNTVTGQLTRGALVLAGAGLRTLWTRHEQGASKARGDEARRAMACEAKGRLHTSLGGASSGCAVSVDALCQPPVLEVHVSAARPEMFDMIPPRFEGFEVRAVRLGPPDGAAAVG